MPSTTVTKEFNNNNETTYLFYSAKYHQKTGRAGSIVKDKETIIYSFLSKHSDPKKEFPEWPDAEPVFEGNFEDYRETFRSIHENPAVQKSDLQYNV